MVEGEIGKKYIGWWPTYADSFASQDLLDKRQSTRSMGEDKKVILPRDYIRLKLTGSLATDWTDASATMLFDLLTLSWSDEVCEVAGIDKKKLPEVVPPTEVIGRVTQIAASDIGLLKGTPVIAGCSDIVADSVAAGAIHPGGCLIRLGTCGALLMVTDQLDTEQTTRFYVLAHCVPKRRLLHLVTPAGLPMKRFIETFGEGRFIEQELEEIPPGSEGLIFYPYLGGEHTPRIGCRLVGGFVGITQRHKKVHFARAIYEGVAFSLRECFELLRNVNPTLKSIKLVGGGEQKPILAIDHV